MNLKKLAIPGVIALALAGAVVGNWVNQIIQRSFRTEGTVFSEYAVTYPAVNNPAPSQSFFCNPAYKTRWAGCTLKQ
jgi:hypothetical protein